jgi:hypothetical protein
MCSATISALWFGWRPKTISAPFMMIGEIKAMQYKHGYGFAVVIGILTLCVVAGGWLVFSLNQGDPSGKTGMSEHSTPHTPRFDRLHVTDFSYSSYDNSGQRRLSFRAEDVLHKKMRIGPLTVGALKELDMLNVRVEIEQMEASLPLMQQGNNPEAGHELFPSLFFAVLKEMMKAQGLGTVSRVVIQGFVLDVLRLRRPHVTITANKVIVGLASPSVVFREGFTLLSQNGSRLEAKQAEWRDDRKGFFIKGAYVLKDATGPHFGIRALFTVDHTGKIHEVTAHTLP